MSDNKKLVNVVLTCPLCKNNMEIEELVLGVWVKCKPCKLMIGGDRGFKTFYKAIKHYKIRKKVN